MAPSPLGIVQYRLGRPQGLSVPPSVCPGALAVAQLGPGGQSTGRHQGTTSDDMCQGPAVLCAHGGATRKAKVRVQTRQARP